MTVAGLGAGREGDEMHDQNESDSAATVRCEACPIRCRIKPGRTGACDRYGNNDGVLVRVDPVTVLRRTTASGGAVVPFLPEAEVWAGELLRPEDAFITGAGASTTYPDYKPAPFIVSNHVDGVDTVTVVTEGIFSYCGVRVKIDTDRHIGPERAAVFADGEEIGHVTTAEYGSQMLSLGGVRHLTGGSRNEGLATLHAMLDLCEKRVIELDIEGGSTLEVQAGAPPTIDGVVEERMRVGCGSATIGMFATSWHELVDEVVVVDEHITGVLSQHQAGVVLGMRDSGIRLTGRKSTPGRWFHVAEPGSSWGGTDVDDPIQIVRDFDARLAWPGLRLLMVSTTGDSAAYFVLDEDLRPVPKPIPGALVPTIDQIGENCEPALTSVLFVAGAGGSLRAGVTNTPIRLTRSVKVHETQVTCGGSSAYVWPGGGIMIMVDVMAVPPGSFGYVPTPAIVAPLEFTLPRESYRLMGGHDDAVRPMEMVLAQEDVRVLERAEMYQSGSNQS